MPGWALSFIASCILPALAACGGGGGAQEVTAAGDAVWRYGGMETPGGFDVLANGGLLISDWALDRVFEIGPRSAP